MEELKFTEDGRVKLPQPHEISTTEKDDAMGAYLMMFAAWGAGLPFPLINLIAAVIYFYINKKRSRFVAFHAYQSLITQIPVSLLNAGLVFWLVLILFSKSLSFNQSFFIYLFFVIVWNLIYTIFSLVACVKARKGQFYYFIFFGRIAFEQYYGKNAQKKRAKEIKNIPPKGY